MAVFRGTIRSRCLRIDTTVNVIVPYEQHYIMSKTPPDKTVILLHGIKQNADTWTRMSRVEQFAHRVGFNVVIPDGQRSFYSNMAHGLPYFDYITNELPEAIDKIFHIPLDADHLYAAGLSMGGFGALKCALTYPDRFAGATRKTTCSVWRKRPRPRRGSRACTSPAARRIPCLMTTARSGIKHCRLTMM